MKAIEQPTNSALTSNTPCTNFPPASTLHRYRTVTTHQITTSNCTVPSSSTR